MRVHKQIRTYMMNWFLTKLQRQFSGESTVFSTNGGGTTGYLYAKLSQIPPAFKMEETSWNDGEHVNGSKSSYFGEHLAVLSEIKYVLRTSSQEIPQRTPVSSSPC